MTEMSDSAAAPELDASWLANSLSSLNFTGLANVVTPVVAGGTEYVGALSDAYLSLNTTENQSMQAKLADDNASTPPLQMATAAANAFREMAADAMAAFPTLDTSSIRVAAVSAGSERSGERSV